MHTKSLFCIKSKHDTHLCEKNKLISKTKNISSIMDTFWFLRNTPIVDLKTGISYQKNSFSVKEDVVSIIQRIVSCAPPL
jgi:hypothetical protein